MVQRNDNCVLKIMMTDEYDDMSIVVTSKGIMRMMAIKEMVMTYIRGEMMIVRMNNRMNNEHGDDD